MSESALLSGVAIEGFERDMSLELDMGLDPMEGIGYTHLFPHLPADGSCDSIKGDVTLWVHGSAAKSLEAILPPYGSGPHSMYLPQVQGTIAVPGINGVSSGTGFSTISNVLVTEWTSQGRKGPGLDLFGYKLSFRIPCDLDASGFSATVPDIVARKFGAHQWTDWSHQGEATTVALGARSWDATLQRTHGRRYDANVDLDHCTYADAQALIQWARALRADAGAFPVYAFGPTFAGETITARLLKLTASHSNGLFWAVRLEMTLADSTATTPTISGISPQYIVSGTATNVVISGSGFDASTTVTIGGVSCVVSSWTSGRLMVTAPAGTAGQYEVVVTNTKGSATGTLWRYDAGEITIGTGGVIVATTAVAISKNQLVGLNASGDAVLADAVLGIVAVGYANADAAIGAALQINQTGHATPVAGLTDGQPVYLGVAGTYVTTPPSGATISQQVGVGTATGVAVAPQQAIYLA